MENNNNNKNTIDINIDDLFKDEQVVEIDESITDTKNTETDDKKLTTEAVSKRINEVRHKTETETQNKIAKELGYQDYADLQKATEKKILKDAGLDEEDISAVVEKLVEQRLANDARFKKLEEFENREKQNFVTSQLKEINAFASTNYTSIEELPKDTLDLWEKTGNLKQAYLATQGEALLSKAKNSNNSSNMNGSTKHMYEKGGNGTGSKTRHLTAEEIAIWKSVMPDITDEELSKKTVTLD